METTQDSPRIYVACLAAYNNGRMHGVWIDCEGKDSDDLQADIYDMLRNSPEAGAEEWAIHNYEGFGTIKISESQSMNTIATCTDALIGDYRVGFCYLVSDIGMSISDAAEQAETVQPYTSDAWDLFANYAEELACDIIEDYENKASMWPFNCIDWKAAGRELLMGGDIAEFECDGTSYIITNASEF